MTLGTSFDIVLAVVVVTYARVHKLETTKSIAHSHTYLTFLSEGRKDNNSSPLSGLSVRIRSQTVCQMAKQQYRESFKLFYLRYFDIVLIHIVINRRLSFVAAKPVRTLSLTTALKQLYSCWNIHLS